MNPVVQSLVRGLHDLFAATWAGGLLVMALVVFPTLRSMRAGTKAPSAGPATEPSSAAGSAGPAVAGGSPVARFMVAMQRRLRRVVSVAIVGVFLTGVLLLVFSIRTGSGFDVTSVYGALMVAKIVLSVAMLVIAVVRSAKLRRLGDEPGGPRRSGVPLVLANAVIAAVVLILSGVAGTFA